MERALVLDVVGPALVAARECKDNLAAWVLERGRLARGQPRTNVLVGAEVVKDGPGFGPRGNVRGRGLLAAGGRSLEAQRGCAELFGKGAGQRDLIQTTNICIIVTVTVVLRTKN